MAFPFSDLSNHKLRPALVLADAQRGDWILCQITSKPYADAKAIELEAADFDSGGLNLVSFVRPGKIFTASDSLIKKRAGTPTRTKHSAVISTISKILQDGK